MNVDCTGCRGGSRRSSSSATIDPLGRIVRIGARRALDRKTCWSAACCRRRARGAGAWDAFLHKPDVHAPSPQGRLRASGGWGQPERGTKSLVHAVQGEWPHTDSRIQRCTARSRHIGRIDRRISSCLRKGTQDRDRLDQCLPRVSPP